VRDFDRSRANRARITKSPRSGLGYGGRRDLEWWRSEQLIRNEGERDAALRPGPTVGPRLTQRSRSGRRSSQAPTGIAMRLSAMQDGWPTRGSSKPAELSTRSPGGARTLAGQIGRRRRHVRKPKDRGYRAINLVVMPDERRIEIQSDAVAQDMLGAVGPRRHGSPWGTRPKVRARTGDLESITVIAEVMDDSEEG